MLSWLESNRKPAASSEREGGERIWNEKRVFGQNLRQKRRAPSIRRGRVMIYNIIITRPRYNYGRISVFVTRVIFDYPVYTSTH